MNLQKKRIIVTGANGFVGSHLSQVLNDQGAQVIGLVRSASAHNQHLTEQYVVDISDRQQLQKLMQDVQPEFIIHLAATKNRSHDFSAYHLGYDINLLGTMNLIEACRELQNLTRFVFLGSCDEYGVQAVPFVESSRETPVSAYGVTKLAVTQMLQTLARVHSFPAVVLRPTVVYGPGQGKEMFLPALIDALVSHERFAMSKGEQTRDFVYVDDLVDAILRTLVTPNINGELINISSASPVRIEELARKTAQMIGAETENLLGFGVRDYRAGESMNYWASNSHAKALLKWVPHVSLEDGLRLTIDYFRTSMMLS